VVHAEVMRASEAMRRFGPAGHGIIHGDIIRWLDTGRTCPALAALLEAERAGTLDM
jgi:hypothetical protein